MNDPGPSHAQQIAEAASAFEREQMGRRPQSVAVVLAEETLVVILHGALSPAEQALAQTGEGAALLQQFDRELFADACGPLRQEVERITGWEVRQATTEVQGASGTVLLVFLLSGSGPAESWHGAGSPD